MNWSKGWEVFHQANQGICIFNCKLKNMYANEKAKQILKSIAPELCRQFKSVCRRFIAMIKVQEASLVNYSGMLHHHYDVMRFSCFSFYSEEQIYIMVVFDYRASNDNGLAAGVTFTPREQDIIQAIAAGKTNKEISKMLCIGFETVKSHVRNLLAKTGTSSRAELISKHCYLE
jgi:DNA-binding CsgD family transcriptional regulator